MKNIVVYGASSARIDPEFIEAGVETGRSIARAGFGLVCGGGKFGMMGAAIDGCIEAGGRAIGVLPEFMDSRGWAHPALTEKIVTPDMHSRKARMLGLASGVIALAGGIGTFEELLEALTWRKLGLWQGEIVILNTRGYYNPLDAQLREAEDLLFGHADYSLTTVPAEAVAIIAGACPE